MRGAVSMALAYNKVNMNSGKTDVYVRVMMLDMSCWEGFNSICGI